MKKAQSQIITTVLIILLVLAAIVIVWQVVNTTVTSSAEQIEGGTDCVTIGLEITDLTTTTATVRRRAGEGDLDKIRVIVDGTRDQDADVTLDELSSTTITFGAAASSGEVVEVAAILSNGKVCDIADTATVA